MSYDRNQLAPLYAALSDGHFVGANVLGEPFFDVVGTLIKVSPETGEREEVGTIAELGADLMQLDDYWTAASLRAAWEDKHGPLGDGRFLVPRTPFVLGGEFEIANLMPLPFQEAIDFYQAVRSQVSSLKDGDGVQIEVGK